MKSNEQQHYDETTTTTTECDNNQQHQKMRIPTKLMVKVKGIEITDMKKFLESKRKNRAVLLDNKVNLIQLSFTRSKKIQNFSAHRGQTG